MTISFNEIPNDARVPFIFVEFDTSRAQQGPSIQSYHALIIGQRLSGGSKPAGQVDLVSSDAQADEFYGRGSMLAAMIKAFRADNKSTKLSAISLDDDGGSVAATSDLTIVGTATENGTLVFKVAGRRYRVGVSDTDTETDVAAAIVAEVTADGDAQVTASNLAGVVTFTHRNKGIAGNEMDLRVNPDIEDRVPAGITATPDAAFTSGATNPDITSVITAMGEVQYNVIAMPYTDSANLTLLETELADRFGPIRPIDGVAFAAKRDTFANLITFGDGRNSPHVSTMGIDGPSNPWEWAANYCAVVGRFGQIDPARPFQTLSMTGIDSPDDDELFTFDERNLLLKDGIATYNKDSGGVVRIERAITMFQENSQGSPDTSLLDVNTLLTLSFMRFDFRAQMQNTYPRHKLIDDGNRVPPGQAVVTPGILKAKAVAIARAWVEDLAIMENIDQFKRDLVVERNTSDPNRADFLMPPDLANQFRIGAAQIGFLL